MGGMSLNVVLGKNFPSFFCWLLCRTLKEEKGGRREKLKSEEVTRGRTVHKNSSESLKLGKS